ncbi:ABC-type branched-subunit amino acid transport system ATPase component/branched-subunit amino acid ABC-type transport system permease component [Streptomyces phaeochromogenes]|uniref:ABC transporter permease subunit n=1 Tax=Streptomyces phaeochromogenes TaxID=1923 RepID=UPI0027923BF6|nr:ATP-binding cassette domain-containing protein [Streptomyces phaeochromogenes]MDQ0948376.1 ABC-type branched-subunit amino acid transport system ATPase component/branched-subunit amino acid ABC-type transport system permease component [Streptomyces phaeochromogenes]
MADLLGFVLSGLVSGALYALLATGLVLSYSASGLFNFAHGATAYLCALAFYEMHSGFGWPAVPTAVLLVCVAAPALGWGLDRLMFRKLARVGETAQIVATIGLLVALPALGLWIVELLEDAGASVKPAENQFGLPGVGPSPAKSWQLTDGVGIDSDQLITWVATALVAVGLWVLMRHTPLGLKLRAAVDDRSLVELRGLSADRLSSIAWMLSSGLAGLAGVLATPLLGLSAHDFTLFLFVSATAAVLGRFVSIPLAFAGGLGLGVLQNLVAGYAGFAERITGFRTAVPFLILFAGLLLLTRRSRTAGTAAVDAPPVDYLAGRSRLRRWGPWAAAAVLLAVAFYTVTTPFWSGILAQGLALSLVFVSFTVVTGLGAMVSLAQATFVTGAALVAGLLMSHGWPFVAAAAVGTCAAAVLGALVALPALRLGGRSLALATLALAFLADQVLFQIGWLRNGDTGWSIPRPVFGPVDLNDDRAFGVALLVLVTAAVAALSALRGSPSGRAMLAVRSAPAAAMASGVSVVRTKLVLFTLSAGLAGFGGVMYASYNTRVTATDFTAMTGLIWLAVVVAAGLRRPQFAVVAGLVYALVPHLVSDYVTESVHLPVILFGLAGLALANDPDGYCAAVSVRVHRRRLARGGPAGAGAGSEAGAMAGAKSRPTSGVTDTEPESETGVTGGTIEAGSNRPGASGAPSGSPADASEASSRSPASASRAASGGPADASRAPSGSPADASRAPGRSPASASRAASGGPADASRAPSGSPADASRAPGRSPASASRAASGGPADTPGAPSGRPVGVAQTGAPATASSSPAEPPALELRAVRAGYDGAPVLHGVDLAVRPGEIVALLGPNGAGKSTTCRVAAGLVGPLGGQVYVAGRDATREGAVRRSRAGVVLAPEGRGIFPALTIEENLALYLREKDQREAVYERFPGLAGRRGVPAGSLSGGEQQMLALAPLLQRPPKVLIADEPSLGLAPRVVEEVFRLLTELRDTGTALLLVEEKATEALGVADTVAYLAQGRVTWCGPRASVETARLTEAYLGLAATPEADTGPGTGPDAGSETEDEAETGRDPGPSPAPEAEPGPGSAPTSPTSPTSPTNPTIPSQTRGGVRP